MGLATPKEPPMFRLHTTVLTNEYYNHAMVTYTYINITYIKSKNIATNMASNSVRFISKNA